MLLEAPLFDGGVEDFLAATDEVRARGYGTLIGHPERCAPLMWKAGAVAAERQAGARLQVNGFSLTGLHGADAARWGAELIRTGQADVIASDAHRPSRGPVLSRALAVLSAAGVPVSEDLVSATPRAFLAHGLAAARAARAA